VQKRKLIEVALPLEAINRESAREKSIRHGHPSTLHLWWSRKPLAAARAILFAQLVDDPSSLPEQFPTEELQRKERDRLHALIERLVLRKNANNAELFDDAHAEILKSTQGKPPRVLDPFAGGGTIPLEAQRLGLEAHASDLNPVAVLINKALIEVPPKFRDKKPVFPGLADSEIRRWTGAEGLAADVRAYGSWMRDEAADRIGPYYPKATLSDRTKATVIAWIWARTVICPNPACGIELPLTSKWWLSTKSGKQAFIVPSVVRDATHPSGNRVKFRVGHGRPDASFSPGVGTVGRAGATCVACGAAVDLKYVRSEGAAGRMGQTLMATVAEGSRSRVYLDPDEEQRDAASVDSPRDLPDSQIPAQALGFRVQAYGITQWRQLFTSRQQVALMTFSDLVTEARSQILVDGGSPEYADAVATYLALCASKMSVFHCSLSRWRPDADKTAPAFGRQVISMVWDFAESVPLAGAGGDWIGVVDGAAKTLEGLRPAAFGEATQKPAQAVDFKQGMVVSTDPPYYDNIGYADLSDYFYVWLRRTLRPIYPDLFGTMLVPKNEELVANPYRHGGGDNAKLFFENGFRKIFAQARQAALNDFPMTVYYAFKQSERDESGEASTGWETLLEGMIRSGWEITSTWPVRTETATRMRGQDSNALASSIVLSLRPRPSDAPTTDRRGFIAALTSELPDALRKLQQGQIAPVDLPQAAIGPGMAVYSRYGTVLEPNGTSMSVRSALARINEILDQVLNEQEGDFDPTSRFAIAWYRQHGYGVGKFGGADDLARARNTSVDVMDRDGILTSRANKVQLIKPEDLSWDYDPVADSHTSNWEALHHLIKTLERDGIAPAGDFLRSALRRPDGAVDTDLVKELAHLLFRIAESNGWTQDALSFNNLVTSWPEILDVVLAVKKQADTQGALDFEEED
jgi:putative DNA methylase